MADANVRFTVFTKPWRMDLPELGKFIAGLGFDGIELPVRPGYPVLPENVGKDLPKAVKILGDFGVTIDSIAGPTDEPTIAACAEANVPVIRVCESVGPEPYMEWEARRQREFDALVPLLSKYGVTLGIQNHYGTCVANAMGILHLIEKYDPKAVGAVWDCAHNGLHGEEPEMALDIVWSHLCLVNFKSAFWLRINGPEAKCAEWSPYFTTGRHGLSKWPRVADELKKRNYKGAICLTAEYSDEESVDRLIAKDIKFAKSLFV
ncbi:MAG: TIM barrel protein [bacterium]|jgi:sugar phosphate isomerase/epimerase